jgi:hypothetical protein
MNLSPKKKKKKKDDDDDDNNDDDDSDDELEKHTGRGTEGPRGKGEEKRNLFPDRRKET